MPLGFRPKLLDFGLSKFQGRTVSMQGGTLAWRAPETLLPGASAGAASDVYSFGWMALLVVAGVRPHHGLSGEALQTRVLDLAARGDSPEIDVADSAPFHAECQALCSACLQGDPWPRCRRRWAHGSLWRPSAAWATPQRPAAARLADRPGLLARLRRGHRRGAGGEGPRGFRGRLPGDLRRGGGRRRAAPAIFRGLVLDWLEDPAGFRILVLATLADLRAGVKAPPLEHTLISVNWRPPGACARALSIRMLFPSVSGLVKLRLRPLPEAPAVQAINRLSL